MPVTISLEVYGLIFDYFRVRAYDIQRYRAASDFSDVIITPFFPSEALAQLHALSLTCKRFNGLARTISLRDSFIYTFSDFTQLCRMAKHCRVFPIETLNIFPSDTRQRIQDITSAEFLSIMKQCVRLRGLRMFSPLITLSNLPHALESLTQWGTLTNLRSLELSLRDYDNDFRMPDPRDLIQVLLLMPCLTVLHINMPLSPDVEIPETSEFPPPPFRLKYLVINYGYFNLSWLTSTSHNSLRVAYIFDVSYELSLNLDHPWTKLRYLNLVSLMEPETMLEMLRYCPLLTSLATQYGIPMMQYQELDLVRSFDALQHPLSTLILVFTDLESSSDPDEEEEIADFTILATALENHPFLAQLTVFTIELSGKEFHEQFQIKTLPLQEACEAKNIEFAIVCNSLCARCGEPGRDIPLPDEYDLDIESSESDSEPDSD